MLIRADLSRKKPLANQTAGGFCMLEEFIDRMT